MAFGEGISRLEAARTVVGELLDELENCANPIAQSLMKAKRLARLMRDSDAQTWLDLETRGYPEEFHESQLGSCAKYAYQGGRISTDGKYWKQSLPELEASIKANELSLAAMKFPASLSPSASSSNPREYVAPALRDSMTSVTAAFNASLVAHRDGLKQFSRLYFALRSAVHNYATEEYLALLLGDAAEDVFQRARKDVDSFVKRTCPKAAEQLVAVYERLREGKPEELAQALTSCRRILSSVADAVYPPCDVGHTDGKGRKRKVGPEEYKNRLLAFIEHGLSESSKSVADSELDHLAARLDAVYEKTCKGVHDDVTPEETRLALIHTYLFLAEIARLVPSD